MDWEHCDKVYVAMVRGRFPLCAPEVVRFKGIDEASYVYGETIERAPSENGGVTGFEAARVGAMPSVGTASNRRSDPPPAEKNPKRCRRRLRRKSTCWGIGLPIRRATKSFGTWWQRTSLTDDAAWRDFYAETMTARRPAMMQPWLRPRLRYGCTSRRLP
mmetsp:Transcript_51164/g.153714  ORF Transcript_51164/g.153714 Transcript_51164/m.153714 type:complete len:160 (+) Transcript_51164:250-729(+)